MSILGSKVSPLRQATFIEMIKLNAVQARASIVRTNSNSPRPKTFDSTLISF